MTLVRTILIVDDSLDSRELCAKALQSHEIRTITAPTAEEALHLLEASPIDLMVIDFMLPPPTMRLRSALRRERVINGVGLMQEALARRPLLPIVFISAQEPKLLRARGVPVEVPILQKPFWPGALQEAVHRLLTTGVAQGPSATQEAAVRSLLPRKYRRFVVQGSISFHDAQTREGHVQDLSLSGCKVRSRVTVAPGDHLTIRIALPFTAAIKINVAVVRWVTRDEFGLEFVWVDPAMHLQLQQYLKRYDANPSSGETPSRRT